jgi:hypothetical protein
LLPLTGPFLLFSVVAWTTADLGSRDAGGTGVAAAFGIDFAAAPRGTVLAGTMTAGTTRHPAPPLTGGR